MSRTSNSRKSHEFCMFYLLDMTLNKILKVEDILVCQVDDEGHLMSNLLVAGP